jgi:hypothetical protein
MFDIMVYGTFNIIAWYPTDTAALVPYIVDFKFKSICEV